MMLEHQPVTEALQSVLSQRFGKSVWNEGELLKLYNCMF